MNQLPPRTASGLALPRSWPLVWALRRASNSGAFSLQLETGEYLLLESGDRILLEAGEEPTLPVPPPEE